MTIVSAYSSLDSFQRVKSALKSQRRARLTSEVVGRSLVMEQGSRFWFRTWGVWGGDRATLRLPLIVRCQFNDEAIGSAVTIEFETNEGWYLTYQEFFFAFCRKTIAELEAVVADALDGR
jgi:hypothetical protein